MIDLYYWTTPNGHKVTMFLEEAELPYRIVPVDIGRGAQFEPAFLDVAPNNRIPAIVDHAPEGGGAPISVFESGAILLYLADKTKRFIAEDLRGRNETLQWLFWQMAGLGPMAGQNNHFQYAAPEKLPLPYAIERYVKETSRLYAVLDHRLADREFVAGAYSIADMAAYPWIVPHERHGQKLGDYPDRAGQRRRAAPDSVRAGREHGAKSEGLRRPGRLWRGPASRAPGISQKMDYVNQGAGNSRGNPGSGFGGGRDGRL